MRPLRYARAATADEAVRLAAAHAGARFVAGGTNIVDLLKFGVDSTDLLIDVSRLPLAAIESTKDGGLRIGATTDNTTIANHPLVRTRYPVLSEALLSGASPQIRNRATMAGNLLQRTRCPYFYDPASACNRRTPGQGCAARGGFDRSLALFGGSASCSAVHPSDMCVALAVLDAVVVTLGPGGGRRVPLHDFLLQPGDTPHHEHDLSPGELVVSVELPAPHHSHSRYLKIRDRQSYEFALVSVALVLDRDGDVIRDARVAFGGIATVPWRDPAVERFLLGRRLSGEVLHEAAIGALPDPRPGKHNAFKVELARNALLQALGEVAK